MRKSLILAFASLVVLVASVAGGYADAQVVDPSQKPVVAQSATPLVGYRLQKEDAMKISIWDEPNFSTEQVVDPSGDINIQRMGRIHAEGLTVPELTEKMKAGLSVWLLDPKIQIDLVSFHKPKVYVLGPGVMHPGAYEFKAGDRVMEALAMAGSFSDIAALQSVKLMHNGSKTEMPLDLDKLFYHGDTSQNVALEDGDTIFIPEDTQGKYAVVGEVVHPGQFRLKKNTTVIDAISNAGGATPRGVMKSVYVLRAGEKGPERVHVDLQKFVKKGDLSQNIELKPSDVIYVPETKSPNWEKVASLVSATVNTIWLFHVW